MGSSTWSTPRLTPTATGPVRTSQLSTPRAGLAGSLTEGCHARADYDISTKGREISRPPHGNLLFPAAVMASSIRGFPKSARDAELQAFAQRIAPQSPGEGSAMIGGRHFWQSDYTAYHAESHFTSLKMFSKRMTNNEICNNENLKADHTADGALYTYQSGQEYRGIFPVWDWSREPPRYRCRLGCIPLKMAAISLLTGARYGTAARARYPEPP